MVIVIQIYCITIFAFLQELLGISDNEIEEHLLGYLDLRCNYNFEKVLTLNNVEQKTINQ